MVIALDRENIGLDCMPDMWESVDWLIGFWQSDQLAIFCETT